MSRMNSSHASTCPTDAHALAGNCKTRVFANVSDALAAAGHGDGLLVMAEGMLPSNPGVPQRGTGANISAAQWAQIDTLGLFVYLEFPTALRNGVPLAVSVACVALLKYPFA